MLIFQKLAQQQKYQNCCTLRYIPKNRQDQTLLWICPFIVMGGRNALGHLISLIAQKPT